MILKYKEFLPEIDKSVFIAEGSVVIGQVKLGKNASVWFNVTIRGDMDKISIGENTNIQDGVTIHNIKGVETKIGNNVTVGHNAVLHSCEVGDGCLVGMGSIVLDNVKIGKNCLIGAGSLVTPGTVIPDNSLVMGSPAKVVRELKAVVIGKFQHGVAEYLNLAESYKSS